MRARYKKEGKINNFLHEYILPLVSQKEVVAASANSFDLSFPELSKRHWSVKAFKGAVRQIPVSQRQQYFFFSLSGIRNGGTA